MTTRPKVKPKPVRWTRAAIVGLGVITDLRTLGSILTMSETSVREAYHDGRLPEPLVVIRAGRKLVVPVAPILALLGLDGSASEDRYVPGDRQPPAAGEHVFRAGTGPGGPSAA
jgi:hypothetical protein